MRASPTPPSGPHHGASSPLSRRASGPRSSSYPRLLLAIVVAVAMLAPAGVWAAAGAEPLEQQAHAGATASEASAGQAGQEAEHAPGDEHGAAQEHEPAPWWEFPARLLNFGLLVALLWWGLVRTPPAIGEIFSFPGLAPLLANRASQIKEDKAVAQERKGRAREILDSTASRLDRIEVEVAELVEEARGDAEREKRRAEKEGRERAEKIRETASRELRAESLGAQRQLREFVARLAVDMAEKTLRRHLTPADQERLRRDYLSRIGARLQ